MSVIRLHFSHSVAAWTHACFQALSLSLVLVCALAICGCGFRLAGTELHALLEQGVSIHADNRYQSMQSVLQGLLKRANVPDQQHWKVNILSISKNNHTLVSDRRGFDLETDMRLRMQFQITDPTGKTLPPRNVSATRRLSQNLRRLNVTTSLEDFYYQELERELAEQLLQELAFIAKTDIDVPVKP